MADFGGLLDFIKTPEGQGLLSATFGGLAGAQRGAPLNSIGRAGIAGLTGYGGALDRQAQQGEAEQQKRYREMQMQHQQSQMDAMKRQQENEGVISQAAQGAFVSPERANALSMGPMPDGSSVPEVKAGFDSNQFVNSLFSKGLATDALKYQKLFEPKAADYKEVGDTLLRIGGNGGVTPVYTAPAKPEGKPTKVQEYEYAKANGYKGTLEQYVSIGPSIMASAVAPLRNAQIQNMQDENAYNLPAPVSKPRVSAGVSVTTPDGRVFSFPDTKAANNFKMKAGIK